jgi:hypothetical protein
MNFTTPDLVAIRMAQLEAEAAAERMGRIARVTAWAQSRRRDDPGSPRPRWPLVPGAMLRVPRL